MQTLDYAFPLYLTTVERKVLKGWAGSGKELEQLGWDG